MFMDNKHDSFIFLLKWKKTLSSNIVVGNVPFPDQQSLVCFQCCHIKEERKQNLYILAISLH